MLVPAGPCRCLRPGPRPHLSLPSPTGSARRVRGDLAFGGICFPSSISEALPMCRAGWSALTPLLIAPKRLCFAHSGLVPLQTRVGLSHAQCRQLAEAHWQLLPCSCPIRPSIPCSAGRLLPGRDLRSPWPLPAHAAEGSARVPEHHHFHRSTQLSLIPPLSPSTSITKDPLTGQLSQPTAAIPAPGRGRSIPALPSLLRALPPGSLGFSHRKTRLFPRRPLPPAQLRSHPGVCNGGAAGVSPSLPAGPPGTPLPARPAVCRLKSRRQPSH